MQRFRVDLKTFLGLAMPSQCCHAVTKWIFGWFVGGFGQEMPNLNDPYDIYKYKEKFAILVNRDHVNKK